MNGNRPLILEIASGPLDGAAISLETETDAEWSSAGAGPLTFPWDAELGQPQARFAFDEENDCWYLDNRDLDAPHGTYRINREEKVKGKVQLERGDILKASRTWLLVHQA